MTQANTEIYLLLLTGVGSVMMVLVGFIFWLFKKSLTDLDEIKVSVAQINGKIHVIGDIQIAIKDHDRSIKILDNKQSIISQRIDDLLLNGRAHQ